MCTVYNVISLIDRRIVNYVNTCDYEYLIANAISFLCARVGSAIECYTNVVEPRTYPSIQQCMHSSGDN